MGGADITLSYCMYSEYRDDVEFLFPFAYLQYLSRYTIHVDRYLKTHLLIFFKEKTVFKVCVSS